MPFVNKLTGGYRIDISKYSGLVSVKDKTIKKEFYSSGDQSFFQISSLVNFIILEYLQ